MESQLQNPELRNNPENQEVLTITDPKVPYFRIRGIIFFMYCLILIFTSQSTFSVMSGGVFLG